MVQGRRCGAPGAGFAVEAGLAVGAAGLAIPRVPIVVLGLLAGGAASFAVENFRHITQSTRKSIITLSTPRCTLHTLLRIQLIICVLLTGEAPSFPAQRKRRITLLTGDAVFALYAVGLAGHAGGGVGVVES